MASRDKKQPEKRDDSFKSEMMHRFKTHPLIFAGTVIVLVIIIIAFVFVPAIVPSAPRGGDLTFGYYNKTPIKYVLNNYFYQVQQILTQRQQPAPDDSNYMITVAGIWRSAFEETVIHMGILDEMKQAGFIAPEDVIDKEMARLPHFQENGRFSSAKYRAMDNNTRMNLRKQVEESYIAETFLSDLRNMKNAPNEVSFISSMASPKRSFDLVVFPLSTFPDSEVVSYARTNPAPFRTVRLSMITAGSEREARQILDTVKNGTATFEEAARANSQDWAADRGGDMGAFMDFELTWLIGDDKIRESVFNLAKGEFSEIYKAQSGWAFYRIDEASYPLDTNDMSQNRKIRSYIMENFRGLVEDWVIAETEKFSVQVTEKGFDEAIAAEDKTKNSFGPISLNYGSTNLFASMASAGVSELENAGSNQFFWRAAFKTPLNSLSEPLVIGDNVILLLPLEEIYSDEEETDYIEAYYYYWMRNNSDGVFRSYFLNNKKLDDRFYATFRNIWVDN
ncbi:MAG: SurA N-terminal domain-containing protein [Treponema sp.]|jgi:hypothetical protein|nr:SurA N-terminal domain-containing protein [Treponema sp.]